MIGVSAVAAHAQSPLPLPAPGFETANPFSPNAPAGFTNNNDVSARRRRAGDGLVPDVTARTGDWCIEIGGRQDGGFDGITTDTRNFFAPGFPFFDPVFDWEGGDVLVTAWYMIPADRPVTGSLACIKLDAKGAGNGNQNCASFDPWEAGSTYADRLISGHTDGQWREFRILWTHAEIEALLNARVAAGEFVVPPYPNRIKLTFGRFNNDVGSTPDNPIGGTIFWDDLSYGQVQAPTCRADFNGDTFVDPDDLSDYIACYFAIPPCNRADFNGDGNADPDDLSDFIALFFGGC